MNSITQWRATITILDPDRRAFWERAIGTATLPIRSLQPVIVDLPDLPAAPVVFLDLDAVTTEMRDRIVAASAERFGLDPALIRADMAGGWCPILATNSLIECTDLEAILRTLE